MKEKENKTERMSLYLTKETVERCEFTKALMMEFHPVLTTISNNLFVTKLIELGLNRIDEDLVVAKHIKETGLIPVGLSGVDDAREIQKAAREQG